MSIAESFLPEFDREMAATRRLLERLPIDRLGWKPHGKSRSLGELATHVTELPRWGLRFEGDRWQVGSEKAPSLTTVSDFLARFDRNVSDSRLGIAKKTDSEMAQAFTVCRPDGTEFFRLDRASIVRRILLNHLIHHRGQLTVYLRLNDVPVPAVYGPSADEAV